jgi:hypothetical protein
MRWVQDSCGGASLTVALNLPARHMLLRCVVGDMAAFWQASLHDSHPTWTDAVLSVLVVQQLWAQRGRHSALGAGCSF